MKQPDIKANIHHILPVSEVNGPGKRSVIWVQGCVFHCKGCFNQDLLSFSPVCCMTIQSIMSFIPISEVEGVTISGGEPFLQAKALVPLAKAIIQSGLTLMVYTGFTFEYLSQSNDKNIKSLLKKIDIMVDGPYDQEIKPNTLWAGSGNQNIHFLTHHYAHLKNKIYTNDRYVEYHITSDGSIKATGFSR